MWHKIKTKFIPGILITILLIGFFNTIFGSEVKWMRVGSLHSWFMESGSEPEIGRTGLFEDQQDGLRWPAHYQEQDCQAAKAFWIGAQNFYDPNVDKDFEQKVVCVGPRLWDDEHEFMPTKFEMTGRFDHPVVTVDGVVATDMFFDDIVDNVDFEIKPDRIIENEINTSIGISVKRKIIGFSQQYHDNYFIYDYVLTNTGIYNKEGNQHSQTLEDVYFFYQFRYAMTKEAFTGEWLPASASWGHNEMLDARGEDPTSADPFRCLYAWQGLHSDSPFDNIGGPAKVGDRGDGHLTAAQFTGMVTIHADKSSSDSSNDPYQPATTKYLDSDGLVNTASAFNQFSAIEMNSKYKVMKSGHPATRHSDDVGNGYANLFGSGAGYTHCAGYGPYTLEIGDSVHIVIAEAVAGLSRAKCYEVGDNWAFGTNPLVMPDGSIGTNRNEYKNTWVFTGRDSLFQTFQRAIDNYNQNYDIPAPPPPPSVFEVKSGGDRITLQWSATAETWPTFDGYKLFRSIHKPDTTSDLIFECDGSNAVTEFIDVTAVRGFNYYYYIQTKDNGTTNTIEPGKPLCSSKFYTITNQPANLKRAPEEDLSQVLVVPNPYNIKAKDMQFGDGAPDRIMFYNLTPECTIRIFSERGDLIQTIHHTDGSGDEAWNLMTKNKQMLVSGLYIVHVQSPGGSEVIKKFIVIR